ncbi:hypothetical protein T552_01284 [Pneumocystis carinii B80]|uniref:FMR1-interacting protein 1 conserved domain-containing protein n=1 Tax=Pneumocystis carinii (strain B80) TaxID=1408658 RepID=A0A0W4ZLT1_PNEC8|nr:hypothetical protein T552_01284 [Pneumocystis carinii B80]KTW29329.1 hypothetical protein T552_01284 [Pneumocystis carinii B80]
MNQQYIYDPPPPPPPKASIILSPLKTHSPVQHFKKKSRVEKIYKNVYNSGKSNFRFVLSKTEKSLKNKPYKPNKPEKYSKYTHSTLLDDGRISHETVFYNKDGYAMSSTANIYEADNDESIENIYKNRDTEEQEDITAWIEERKKKWPTDKNIKKKEEEKLKELNRIKDSFEEKIKLDFFGNNDNCLKSNEVREMETPELVFNDINDSFSCFLKEKSDEKSNYEFKHDNISRKKHIKCFEKYNKSSIWRVRKSLYAKLVEKEEIQENMIILQAIRHLIKFYNIK